MEDFIWKEIQGKKFKVLEKYRDELKDSLANFKKSKGEYSTFGAFYELYLYAFAIGLHLDCRIKLDSKSVATFNMVSEWSDNKPNILQMFLMVLLSDENIRQEAMFDFPSLEMEDLDDREIKTRVNNLIKIFEEFANGGFEYIYDKYKQDPDYFEHYSSLQNFFEDILKKSTLKKSV
jgi:hypothetical protein